MQQQLEGTMAAILKVDMNINLDNKTAQVNLMNIGHVIARDVHATLRVVKRILPSEKEIGTSEPFNFTLPEIALTQDTYQQRERPISLSAQEIDAIRDTREAIRLEGTITYFNGFTQTTIQVCYAPLESHVKNKSGKELSSSYNSQIPCEEFDAGVTNILRNKQKALEQ